jgi:homoserine O-succinyltransferase
LFFYNGKEKTMPVKIPDGLPAAKVLEEEGVAVIPESRAFAQDIRPLRIAVANIMPVKSVAETQLLRLLSNSPLQVSVTLLHLSSHRPKNTAPEYLAKFYKSFEEIRRERFDCLVITGAPVETIRFVEVAYWDELRRIMDWSRTHVYSSLHLCWGAQAGLYHHYGVEKHLLPQKMFGVFPHRVVSRDSALLHGFDDVFNAPHSRYTEVRREDILGVGALRLLAESETAGVYLVGAHDDRQIFISGHPEYDRLALKSEYERDRKKGLNVALPANYFPGDDPTVFPAMSWRGHASLLFTNWLSDVYQKAPFDLDGLEPLT